MKHATKKLLFSGKSQLAEDVSSTFVDPLDCLIVQISTELILQEFDSIVQGGTVLDNKNTEVGKVCLVDTIITSLPDMQASISSSTSISTSGI